MTDHVLSVYPKETDPDLKCIFLTIFIRRNNLTICVHFETIFLFLRRIITDTIRKLIADRFKSFHRSFSIRNNTNCTIFREEKLRENERISFPRRKIFTTRIRTSREIRLNVYNSASKDVRSFRQATPLVPCLSVHFPYPVLRL